VTENDVADVPDYLRWLLINDIYAEELAKTQQKRNVPARTLSAKKNVSTAAALFRRGFWILIFVRAA
jgi:hypothetical protein